MLFISYCSANESFASEVMRRALLCGYSTDQLFLACAPASGIQPGDEWQKALFGYLQRSRAMIIVCSPKWQLSDWCKMELGYAKATAMPIFPLLIERTDLGTALSVHQAIDLTAIPQESPNELNAAFERLWRALRDKHLSPRDIPSWPANRSPFPGLMSFPEDMAPVYFGREPERDQILRELVQMRDQGLPRLLMIAGGSGTGKSSLVRAGVLPWLNHPVEGGRWLALPPLRFNDTNEQHTLLARLAEHTVVQFPENSRPDWKSLRTKLESPDSAQAARAYSETVRDLNCRLNCLGRTLVITIDQFEELLSQPNRPSSVRFLGFLQALLSVPDQQVLALATIRSDFLDIYERSQHVVQSPYVHTFRLPPLPRERVTDVILQPARRAGVVFASDLVDRLKSDFPCTDALPLLAFTLEKLYRNHRHGHNIGVAEYEALGGMAGAIDQAVQKIVPPDLPLEAEAALRMSFVWQLAQLNERNEFVRRSARLSEIPTAARPMLDRFINERLLHTVSEGSESMVEVTHEALFRCWERLRNWLEGSLPALRLRRRMEAIAAEWQASRVEPHNEGDDDLLFTRQQLSMWDGIIETWNIPLPESHLAFLEASRRKYLAQDEMTRRRRRAWRLTWGAATIFLLIASIVFGQLWSLAIDRKMILLSSVESLRTEARTLLSMRDNNRRAIDTYQVCVDLLTRANRRAPQDNDIRTQLAEAQSCLAWSLLLVGDNEDALDNAQQAYNQDPSRVDYAINLTHAFAFNGKQLEARQMLEQLGDQTVPGASRRTFRDQVALDIEEFYKWKQVDPKGIKILEEILADNRNKGDH